MSSESGDSVTGPPPQPFAVGQTAARYLFAISTSAEDSQRRITTGDLREDLGVTPATVTEMLGKLDAQGLVDYEKYEGVMLTGEGERIATEIARRFCAVTNFFETVIETELDDETAFEIGYLIPADGITQLQAFTSATCLSCCPEAGKNGENCSA